MNGRFCCIGYVCKSIVSLQKFVWVCGWCHFMQFSTETAGFSILEQICLYRECSPQRDSPNALSPFTRVEFIGMFPYPFGLQQYRTMVLNIFPYLWTLRSGRFVNISHIHRDLDTEIYYRNSNKKLKVARKKI